MSQTSVSTGFAGLDRILDGLRMGDNVVWLVDDIHDYANFVFPFVQKALEQGRRVVYMRFAGYEPLIQGEERVVIYQLDAYRGFESFATRVYRIVEQEGREAFYVFDCLSELLNAWATDSVIGDFFQVTCPFLFELDTVAYFALTRDSLSFRTLAQIRSTTQLLLILYNNKENIYIQPIKVWRRYSPTMFLPHIQREDSFDPLVTSYEATSLFNQVYWEASRQRTPHRQALASGVSQRHLDYWDRLFLFAENLGALPRSDDELQLMIRKLCKVMLSRDDRMLNLTSSFFDMEDLLQIKSRLIGTGFIGGKAVGMLLARRILTKDWMRRWDKYLEPHDSFFVGSDVFYSYIVYNGWWKLFMEQKTEEGYYSAAAEMHKRMLRGRFPLEIQETFQQMLEYYGQSPIIVRSSSLLEDGFGNAFAGKYDSVFCVNQGTPTERYKQFEAAVKSIYASTMSQDALVYRKQRGLAQKEEPMSLLIQRISGTYRGPYFFPDAAGVGVSYNTYVWSRDMKQEAGMLRMVMGLGTRAVDRVVQDYARIVALDAPLKKTHQNMAEAKKYSQREIDVVHVAQNSFETIPLTKLSELGLTDLLDRFAVRDREAEKWYKDTGRPVKPSWVLTFDPLLSKGEFSALMHKILKTLEKAYNYPVDVEFTVNYTPQGNPLINIVQCRPLQTKSKAQVVSPMPDKIDRDKIFIKKVGDFMGGTVAEHLLLVIYISPEKYSQLNTADQHEVGRIVGELNKRVVDRESMPTLLLGPGRWGTTDPAMGVPVTFSEISNITAIAEVAFSYGDLVPELSFGSHFFQDLVESDIFFMALFPERVRDFFNERWLKQQPNALAEIVPEASAFDQVIRVVRLEGQSLWLRSDLVSQQLLCHFE